MSEDDRGPKEGQEGVQAPRKIGYSQANIDLGQRILYLRTQVLRLEEQKDFAVALGVTRGAVGNWELGRGVSREMLQLIEDRFEVSHDWLTAGTGQPLVEESFDRRVAKLLPREEREQFYLEVEALLQARVKWLGRPKNDNGNK